MLEREARTKWCPFVRNNSGEAVYNRTGGEVTSHALCIGSDCMMWQPQWKQGEELVTSNENYASLERDEPGDWEIVGTDACSVLLRKVTATGDCGLKPSYVALG